MTTTPLATAVQVLEGLADQSADADRVLKLARDLLTGSRPVTISEAVAAKEATNIGAANWRRRLRVANAVSDGILMAMLEDRQFLGEGGRSRYARAHALMLAAEGFALGALPAEAAVLARWLTDVASVSREELKAAWLKLVEGDSAAKAAEFSCRVAWHVAAAVEATVRAVASRIDHVQHASAARTAAEALTAAGDPVPGRWLDEAIVKARELAQTAAFRAAYAEADSQQWERSMVEHIEAAVRVAGLPPWSFDGHALVQELHRQDLADAMVAANGGARYGAAQRAAAS